MEPRVYRVALLNGVETIMAILENTAILHPFLTLSEQAVSTTTKKEQGQQ